MDFNIKNGILIKYNGSNSVVEIPSGVTSIDSDAFSGCLALTSVVIPEGVYRINSYAFYRCRALTSVVIPSTVTSIGSGAFSGCLALTSVVIPSTVTSIGSWAFSRCLALTSVVIPEGVYLIDSYAFSGCLALTSVVIPSTVTSIGFRAFDDCRALTSVVIPSTVTFIGDSAFANCTALTSVVIPDFYAFVAKTIKKTAFANCFNIQQIIAVNRKDAERQLPRELHEKIVTKKEYSIDTYLTSLMTSTQGNPDSLFETISKTPALFNDMNEIQALKMQNYLLDLAGPMTSDPSKLKRLKQQMTCTHPDRNGLKNLFDKKVGWFLFEKSPLAKMTELLKNAATLAMATTFFSPSGAAGGAGAGVEMTSVAPSGK